MMALKNVFMILALTSSLFVGEVIWGQVNVPSARFQPSNVEETDATRPFAQPGIFDYDAQMWAPVEFTNGKQKKPHTGFFFGYERVYMSLGRAGSLEDNNDPNITTGSDWGWGNRFELGWMNEDGDGWDIIYQKGETNHFAAGLDILISTPLLVSTDFSQVEVNKIYRQTLSSGDYFEPYLGFRYFSISDNTLEDTTQAPGPNRFKQNMTNNAPGFQVGGRYNARRGRYRLTGDLALAAAYNDQSLFVTDLTTVGGAVGTAQSSFSSQSFVPVLDGAVELAYDLSRDIALKSSVQVNYLWSGVARANTNTTNLNPNSIFGAGNNFGIQESDFISAGFTFGIEWKR